MVNIVFFQNHYHFSLVIKALKQKKNKAHDQTFFQGDYTPSVATYKHAKVRFNFGPKFRHPPKNVKFRPMSARAEEAAIDQTVADMRFFTENEGKLRLDNYSMSA